MGGRKTGTPVESRFLFGFLHYVFQFNLLPFEMHVKRIL